MQAKAGIPTVLLDVSQDAADKGKDYSRKIVEKDVTRGKMTKEKGDALLALITPSADYALVKGADIVVEAVFENVELKAKVTAQVEEHLGDAAVMGTNTSTLPITGLAKASKRPANFIGIHFFSPVERMGLVEIIMGKKLYVGNLSYDVDSSSLQEMFTPHGNVTSAQVITDRDTGRSKGFGFVEMSSEDEAQAAISAMMSS